ncbi:hypothetical protein EMCRGX_G021610 [Ephydatia muelleri]
MGLGLDLIHHHLKTLYTLVYQCKCNSTVTLSQVESIMSDLEKLHRMTKEVNLSGTIIHSTRMNSLMMQNFCDTMSSENPSLANSDACVECTMSINVETEDVRLTVHVDIRKSTTRQTDTAECSIECTDASPNQGDIVVANNAIFPIHYYLYILRRV